MPLYVEYHVSKGALEQRARSAARRVGLRACKGGRWRIGTVDNRGGFMIVDPYRNCIVVGEKFDLQAEEVIAFCNRD
jgi:hypothetical protein